MAGINSPDGNRNAEVNTDNELLIAPTKTPSKAGLVVVAGESHDGISGKPALRRTAKVSVDKYLSVGQPSQLWEDFFNYTVLNGRKYFVANTAMTSTVANGLITFNNGNSIAANVGYLLRTFKSFALPAQGTIIVDFQFALSIAIQANNNVEIGWGIPSTGIAVPSDGVYFSINNAGAVQLISNYNGTTTNNDTLSWTPTPGRVNSGKLVVHRDRADLYIDDVLLGTVLRANANTVGALSLSQQGYLFARLANTSAITTAQQLKIASWNVALIDIAPTKTPAQIAAENFENAVSVQDSIAVGQTGNYTNSAAPTSATLSNTAAGYTTLGGNFQFAAVAGAETDYALFGYQVPANNSTAEGKSLVITGIEIDTFNLGAAVATTATLLQWLLGVGATAVSLATADGASTKAPHRIPVGNQVLPIGAAIGASAGKVILDLTHSPLLAEPGSFVHLILKMPLGTATASQVIRGTAAIKGYWT